MIGLPISKLSTTPVWENPFVSEFDSKRQVIQTYIKTVGANVY